MVLYTIMPEHLIYPIYSMPSFSLEEVMVNGVRMTVCKNEREHYEIVQVLSTNPNDYLLFQPGQEIM
ncbi:MAG: YlzJ-like family protein [Bacillaceae bacterium]